MSELPFLVVHGVWVWIAMLVVGTAALAFAMHRSYLRRERRELRARVALRSAIASGPRDGASTLRGILRGGGASTLTYERDGRQISGREPGMWLECGGERIELDGPLHVVAGRRWRHARRDFPRGTPKALQEPMAGSKALAMVDAGDEVVVEGDVAWMADRAEHTHRETAGRWVVRPVGARIGVSSTQAAAPGAVGPWWLAAMVAMSLVIVQVGLGVLGRYTLERRAVDDHGAIGFAFSIATAIPNTRGKALHKLQVELMLHGVTTTEQDRRVLAVDELRNRIF